MALQIANPVVVEKVDQLARETGLSKTATVEWAVDAMLGAKRRGDGLTARVDALLHQIDAIPDLSRNEQVPLVWGRDGLPQ